MSQLTTTMDMLCLCDCNNTDPSTKVITTTDAIDYMWIQQNYSTTATLTATTSIVACLILFSYTYVVCAATRRVTLQRNLRSSRRHQERMKLTSYKSTMTVSTEATSNIREEEHVYSEVFNETEDA